MGRLATTDARYQFADLLNRVCYGRERIVLERRGRELAALVPIEDLRALEALERHRDVKEALATLAEGKCTVSVKCDAGQDGAAMPPGHGKTPKR